VTARNDPLDPAVICAGALPWLIVRRAEDGATHSLLFVSRENRFPAKTILKVLKPF